MEEMKNLIIQSLETKGALGQIRAHLRSAVFKIVDEQDQKFNMGCGLKWENPTLYKILETKVGTLITEMMREFMEFFRMDYSLSIFIPECGIYPDRLKKDEILAKLGFSAELNDPVWTKMQLPLMYYMLLFFIDNVKKDPERIIEFLNNTANDVEKKSEELIDENIRDYLQNQKDQNVDIPNSGERTEQQQKVEQEQRQQQVEQEQKQKKANSPKEDCDAPKKRSYEYEDNTRGRSKLSLDDDDEPIVNKKEKEKPKEKINEVVKSSPKEEEIPEQKMDEISIGEEIEENIEESYDKSNEKKSSGNIQTISQSQGLDGTVDSHALENCNYVEPAEKIKK